MVDIITAVYDTTTNLWDEDGGDGTARFRRISVPRNPDARLESYSGNDADPIKAITAAEQTALASNVSAEKDATAQRDIDQNAIIQAVAQTCWEEIQKCQVKQGQTLLTGTQFKARVRTIYRNNL